MPQAPSRARAPVKGVRRACLRDARRRCGVLHVPGNRDLRLPYTGKLQPGRCASTTPCMTQSFACPHLAPMTTHGLLTDKLELFWAV
eukprot:366083-Chlamydomonas_euryale.AAC.21